MPKRRTTVLSRQIIRSDGFGLEGGLAGPTGPAGPATTDASLLSSGTLPNGRFPAVLPAVSGAALTGLTEAQIADGTILARLAAAETIAGLWDHTPGLRERGRTDKVGEWANYTPSWGATGVAPALGNGTIVGRVARVGKTTFFQVTILAGSTTTFGTGFFLIGVPDTANLGTSAKFLGEILDSSAGQVYFGIGQFFSTTQFTVYDSVTRGPIGAATPFAFATGDSIVLSGFFEAA